MRRKKKFPPVIVANWKFPFRTQPYKPLVSLHAALFWFWLQVKWYCDASLGWKRKKKMFSQLCYKVKSFFDKKMRIFFSLLSKRFSPESWVSFLGNGKLVFTSDVMFAARSPLSGVRSSQSQLDHCVVAAAAAVCLFVFVSQFLLAAYSWHLTNACAALFECRTSSFSSTFPCAENTFLTVVSCFRLGNRFCFIL